MIPVRQAVRTVLSGLVAAASPLPAADAQNLLVVTVVGKRAEPLHDAAACKF